MKIAPLPPNEELRLAKLHSYNIIDSPEEKDYDDLAELIAQVCDCEYALVTFMDRERHWFKAKKNVAEKEIPRNTSFCAFTILKDEVLVINDAKKDKRFSANPHVTGGLAIAFYAGAPIVSSDGFCIGTVCALDKTAKLVFKPEQKNALKIIAHQVSTLLELGIRNRQVMAETDAMVAEEKKLTQLTLTGQEDEKSFIANELHENFAQTLAATKLYLDFAEQSKELSSLFIKKSKNNILQIIKDIKALSKSMLPSTYENANYLGFIQEMLEEHGKQNNKKISFKHEGKLDCYDSNIGFTLFRIIQYQLKNAHNCGAKKLSIKIKTAKTIRLEFIDDGKDAEEFKSERKMLLHHIETRLALVKGTVKVGLDKHQHNLLEIEIPLTTEV